MKAKGFAMLVKWFSLCLMAIAVLANAAPRVFAAQGCTHIRVEVNGKSIPSPATVALLKSRGGTPVVVAVSDGCFRLPKQLAKAISIDLIFQANGENVHLIGIDTARFSEVWTVELNDAASDELLATLRATAKEICIVDFDPGGDGTGVAQAGCRTPVKTVRASPAQK